MYHFNSSRYFFLFFSTLIAFGLIHVTGANGQPSGGPGSRDQKLVKDYDEDGDGILNAVERKAARVYLERNSGGRRRRGPGRGQPMEPGKPGPKVKPADVKSYPDKPLYDPATLRTVFLDFENDDWEKELAIFKPTDVEVPATMTVDGKVYPNVGVSFRGASSFFRIPEGLKRSLNLSIDLVDKDQRLHGYKSMNLLNCNGDASMMSSTLYSYIAGQRMATPQANYVKVVINGESWGVYTSSQQFNKVFVEENFSTDEGARWKVSGSPRGDGGLRYLGEEIEPYRERFEIKSKDTEKSWRDLIHLCRALNETPADQLEEALEPILDIDGALWFLAVDIALINSDGYWTRASDYSIYQDPHGKFHILPHDMNEAFRARRSRGGPPRGGGGPPVGGRPPQRRGGGDGAPQGRPQGRGPGGPGGSGGSGMELDPLAGLDEDRKPLRGKLLNNPKLQQRYLQHVRRVAELLEWKNLGPHVEQMRKLIEEEVAADTRKLFTTEAFRSATSATKTGASSTGIRAFAEQRSAYLLGHAKIKELPTSRTD